MQKFTCLWCSCVSHSITSAHWKLSKTLHFRISDFWFHFLAIFVILGKYIQYAFLWGRIPKCSLLVLMWNRQAWELPGGGYFKIITMHDHPHWKVKIICRLEYPTNPSVLLTCLRSCDSSSKEKISISIMYCVNITNLKYNSSKRPVNWNSSRAECTSKLYIFPSHSLTDSAAFPKSKHWKEAFSST